MATGKIRVQVYAAQQAVPLEGARVHIYNTGQTIDETVWTDVSGVTEDLTVPCPERDLSLDMDNDIRPYAIYQIDVELDEYTPYSARNVQVFADETSLLEVEMLPVFETRTAPEVLYFPPHSLYRSDGEYSTGEEPRITTLFDYPSIPTTVTVHLGTPTSNARNVTVPFRDYIKNVASSEIYPTWPRESLRANILCQISLVMNRIYTEWYRSQGYNFDITNSTAYDQYFVYGREYFESISQMVDNIFNEYIRKVGTINPFYAEYCDGRIANCPGLKQWGTVSLAENGYNALEILRYYYGNDVEVVSTNRIENVTYSYPGTNLREGSRGDAVTTIQYQLNRIAINYPAIPVNYPVDGIFGEKTRAAVRAFQRIFNLSVDGIVGKSTWYKISYIYTAVKKLAELTSEGQRPIGNGSYPGFSLRLGDSGVEVQEAQYYLDLVSSYTPYVNGIKVDGRFGSGTRAAVIGFQRLAGLSADGIIGRNTWNALRQAYVVIMGLNDSSNTVVAYPGTALRYGSRGENVQLMQSYLNTLRTGDNDGPILVTDGIFGSATQTRVRRFQSLNNLTVDGVIGRNTWNTIAAQYAQVAGYAIPASEESIVTVGLAGDESNLRMYGV